MLRILLIDDDDTLRTSLRLTLGQMGHDVMEARNGSEGLKLFTSAPVDLVITDIVMPEKATRTGQTGTLAPSRR